MKGVLLAIDRIVDRLAGVGLWVSIGALLSMTALVTVEVTTRKIFRWSTGIMDEYSAYMLAGMIFFSFAIVAIREKHVRVRFILEKLPGSVTRWFYLATEGVTIAYLGLVTWHAFNLVRASYVSKAVAETPAETLLCLPQLSFPLGMTIFIMAVIAIFIKEITRAFSKSS